VTNFLKLAGLELRDAKPEDERFIQLDWLRSGERPFILGHYQPFPHLTEIIARLRGFRDPRDKDLHSLQTLYRTEILQVIKRHMPATMCVDIEQPTFYVGWACPEFVYVKHTYRNPKPGVAWALARAVRS
jgi:hypothetical protein